MKKALVVCVLAAAATWGSNALAIGRLADVIVTDRNTGATLPVYQHRGEYWVAGVPGAKYAIDIRNASGGRVLAVTSVDGVNVVSGETASTAQTGYVFGAWQRYGITGWRKGNDAVAAFEFTASPNSYAERTAARMAKRATPQAAPKLGTGHGERENSYVTNTEFERERSTLNEVIRIRYDSRENLVAMGVMPQYRVPQPRPNAFLVSPVGYVPDTPHPRFR